MVTPYLQYDPDVVRIGASPMHFIFRCLIYVQGITPRILHAMKHEHTEKGILWFLHMLPPLLLINGLEKCLTLRFEEARSKTVAHRNCFIALARIDRQIHIGF